MQSIINLLKWIYENWASIATVVILIFGIYKKAKTFITEWKKTSQEEKEELAQKALNAAIETAKKALADYILILVSKAEIDWQSTDGKLGATKRAQVISEIYAKYPVLEQVADKEELLNYIDDLINKALKTVREELRQPARTLEEKIEEVTLQELKDYERK